MRKILLVGLALGAPLAAQGPQAHLIAAPDAQSKPIFGVVPAVRALPDGRVLVNDIQKRQLSLLDPTLSSATLLADSISGTASSYGTRPGGLFAYLGDTTAFVDPAGLSMFFIDPTGRIARVGSVPRSQDAGAIGNNMTNIPGLDAKGRLVYRAGLTLMRSTSTTTQKPANGVPIFAAPDFPDSAALVRVDLTSRKLDTAAFFKIPKVKMTMQQTDKGMIGTSEINPMPLVDDWAVLADGSIAVVRGQDYHVDFVNPDGSVSSGAKIPYAWQRLTDEDKSFVLDSAKKALETARAAAANAPPGQVTPAGADGGPRMMINIQTGGGGDGGGGMAQRMMAGGGLGGGTPQPVTMVSASELPDYRPAFTAGSTRADADGNLWIRTTAVRAGAAGPIYDVVNRRGELVDRIQLPPGRTLAGFAKGGVVFMVARDGGGSWVERTHR